MRTVAPAKINWTLEVLGRREDGYHKIRSVMQTIDLCDEVVVEEGGRRKKEEGWVRAGSAWLAVQGEHAATEDDLTLRAVTALEGATGRELPVAISLVKRIPVASGLGGGSSDAAAVLRLVNTLYALGLSVEHLADVGATIGSDVPFFVHGGTALVEGRGERVTSLPDAPTAWFTIVVPRVNLPDKTQGMYARLTTADYTDGSITDRVVAAVSSGRAVDDNHTCNAFDRVNFDLEENLQELSDGLFIEGLSPVHTVGAGPSIFVYCDNQASADLLRDYAEAFMFNGEAGTTDEPNSFITADTFVVGTMGAAEATAVAD